MKGVLLPKKTNIVMLDLPGLFLATIFAVLLVFFSKIEFLILLLIFLGVSVIITKYGYEKKREYGLYEHERSWQNVAANGLIPAICAIASPQIGIFPFIGSVSAIMADKFASELGVLSDEEPTYLLNFKKVKKGTNGAISFFGLLMSFDGGLVIGLSCLFLFPGFDLWKVLLIAGIGFAGSFFDSLIGTLEEKGIGNKATTNALCSIAGAVLGYMFF